MTGNKKGFTLIEILLALLVITIGIVAMVGLLGTSLDTSAKSHHDLHAVSFSDMVFNYCHSVTNWSAIPTTGTLFVPDYDGGTIGIQENAVEQFTCRVPGFGGDTKETYTVSYLLDVQSKGRNIKELTLQVWPGYGTNGTPRTFYTELYNWVDK
jgi:prepilin-type N-terminal cleavage/methylation domain-containing protein